MKCTKKILFLLFSVTYAFIYPAAGQQTPLKNKTDYIIIVTLDGFRWQEVFKGADKKLLHVKHYRHKKNELIHEFWDPNIETRRQKLMPFLWSKIASEGVIYGNRGYGNYVNVANRYWFSYPGYNEILTGNPDRKINSNSYGPNPQITILEQMNNEPAFRNRVAVFSSWPAFRDIVNEKRSKIFVNSGFSDIPGDIASPVQREVQNTYCLLPEVIGNVRYDGLTFMEAFEYLKNQNPRILMIALGETDEFGHAGRYDQYLQSANRTDRLLGEIWNWIQSSPVYKDHTTLIITTDHGRGTGKRKWKKHGRLVRHSNETWIAMIGPDTKPVGEVKTKGNYYNAQIASTIAFLLNEKYSGNDPRYSQLTEPKALPGNDYIAVKGDRKYIY